MLPAETVVQTTVIPSQPTLSDSQIQQILSAIPELAYRQCNSPGPHIDFNDLDNMELVHPDDFEPQEAEARLEYFDLVQPRMLTILAMRRRGENFANIARMLGLTEQHVKKYMDWFPEFRAVMTISKMDFVAHLENTAAQAATGYVKELKCEKVVDGVVVPYKKQIYIQPNATVLVATLKQYAGWADSVNINGSVEFSVSKLMENVNARQMEERAKELPPPVMD